jgi:hypothetical protein
MYERIGCVHTLIDDKRIYDENADNFIPCFNQYREYRYILHIDGFVSGWRLALELCSMSVILKVDSPWIEHYYHHLIPWVHYIPIKADLSDLIQTIEWCRTHDDECFEIARNALNYAMNNFTKNKLFNYLESLLYDCPELDVDDTKYIHINVPDKLPRIIEQNHINLDDVKYLRYMMPTKNIKFNAVKSFV